jgi:hypothetical protein
MCNLADSDPPAVRLLDDYRQHRDVNASDLFPVLVEVAKIECHDCSILTQGADLGSLVVMSFAQVLWMVENSLMTSIRPALCESAKRMKRASSVKRRSKAFISCAFQAAM